jgi:hypothetical protein
VSFFAAFRILAWKYIYFTRRVSTLGPEYYCPTCELPQRSKKHYPNCPGCPLTDEKIRLKRVVTYELKRRHKAPEWPFPHWPFDRVKKSFDYVNRLLAENDNRINSGWDRRTAALARVIQQERDITEFWDEWAKRDGKPRE